MLSVYCQDFPRTSYGYSSPVPLDYTAAPGYSSPYSQPPPGYDYPPGYNPANYPMDYYTSEYDQNNYSATEGYQYPEGYPGEYEDLPPGYVWNYPEEGEGDGEEEEEEERCVEEEGVSFGAHQWSYQGDVGSSFEVYNTERLPPIEEQPI